ncbi:hypothetical protein Tco_0755146 [Tanacetum coccineum]
MAEESRSAEVVVVLKFDMQCYESKMTAKDVKLLARKYGVPLDLHPCTPTEGWTMDQLPPEVIGLYEQFFEFSGLRVPFSTFLLDNDFSIQDVRTLTESVIDLHPVPHGLVFGARLATTWDFLGFFPVFKDIEGNVVVMSEYLRFPFLSSTSIEKGATIPPNHLVGQHTTLPLLADRPIPNKTDSQLEVEVEDPKVIAAREKKKAQAARAAAKKRRKEESK